MSIFFFFFSSRRRHTRCSRDWSSDVCSSDLWHPRKSRILASTRFLHPRRASLFLSIISHFNSRTRSEERRVGKECRSRWSPHDSKKKSQKDRKNADLTTRPEVVPATDVTYRQ